MLPDVISGLSKAKEVSNESFQTIIKFLVGFIEKDRQTEGLIEKLCQRFTSVHVDGKLEETDASDNTPHMQRVQQAIGKHG